MHPNVDDQVSYSLKKKKKNQDVVLQVRMKLCNFWNVNLNLRILENVQDLHWDPCTTIPELGLYYPHMIPTTAIGVVHGAAS
jgi:hypothetical protein